MEKMVVDQRKQRIRTNISGLTIELHYGCTKKKAVERFKGKAENLEFNYLENKVSVELGRNEMAVIEISSQMITQTISILRIIQISGIGGGVTGHQRGVYMLDQQLNDEDLNDSINVGGAGKGWTQIGQTQILKN